MIRDESDCKNCIHSGEVIGPGCTNRLHKCRLIGKYVNTDQRCTFKNKEGQLELFIDN